MPPRSKPARRVSARLVTRKQEISPREFERLLERAAKYMAAQAKQLVRTAPAGRKSQISAA